MFNNGTTSRWRHGKIYMIITYRNPGDKNDTIDVHFDIEKNYFTDKWIVELKNLLHQNYHLEKKKVRRGRPAKNKVAVEDSDDDTPKRKRGRPKKAPKKEPTNDELIALMTEALA